MSILEKELARINNYLSGLQKAGMPKLKPKDLEYKSIYDSVDVSECLRFIENPDDLGVDEAAIKRAFFCLKANGNLEDDYSNDSLSEIRESIKECALLKRLVLTGINAIDVVMCHDYIIQPAINMAIYARLHRKQYLKEIRQFGENIRQSLEPSEVYNSLINLKDISLLNDSMPDELSDVIRSELCEAVLQHQEDKFTSLVRNNGIDLSKLKGLCFLQELKEECSKDNRRDIPKLLSIMKVVDIVSSEGEEIVSEDEKRNYEEGFTILEKAAPLVNSDLFSSQNPNLFVEGFEGLSSLVDRGNYWMFKMVMPVVETLTYEEKKLFREVFSRPEGRLSFERYTRKYYGSQVSQEENAPESAKSQVVKEDESSYKTPEFIQADVSENRDNLEDSGLKPVQSSTSERGDAFAGSSSSLSEKENTEFFIPEDFFTNKNYESFSEEEYFTVLSREFMKESKSYVALIKYLTENLFINKEDADILSYRLSGRMRPEQLRRIYWNNHGRAAELLYIIKFAVNDRDKNIKVINYFDGVKWPTVMKDGGNSASVDFKRDMHKINRSVFPLPPNS